MSRYLKCGLPLLAASLLALLLADQIALRDSQARDGTHGLASRPATQPAVVEPAATPGDEQSPLTSAATRPRVASAPRVAVLDFVSTPSNLMQAGTDGPEADPWSFGLADFVSAALEAKGIPVYERRAIGGLLGERALQGSGLARDRQAVQQALPQLRFLVDGNIEARGPERFRVSISALDTRDGRVALETSAEGRYPEELAAALDRLAVQVAETLGGRDSEPAGTPRAPPVGFTRNPDVAVQFYKGLDHLVHGRPEFAVEYFRHAHLADPGFLVAAAWRMRAYEALGLDDLARFVRGTLLAAPKGREVFQLVAPSLAHERGGLVVAVPRRAGANEPLRDVERQIGEQLAEVPGIELFSAHWIRRLADELDLRLSGEISSYEVETQAWLAADLVAQVARKEADTLHIELVDTLSGARVAEVFAKPGDDLKAPITQLVRALHERRQPGKGGESPQRSLNALRPLDYAMPTGDIATYSRQGYAYLLRDFAEQPTDPSRIARHAEVHSLHSYAEHEAGIYDREWGYLELLWQRLLESVDDEDPAAPNWLSLALWKLRLHGNHNGDGDSPNWWYNRGKRVPGIEEHFEPLLRRHPRSLAAFCVRYSLALEHAMWGRHEQAAAILLALVDEPHAEGGVQLDFSVTANLYTMASIEAHTLGRVQQAERLASRARQHAERFTHFGDPRTFEKGRPISGRDHPVEPVIPAVLYTPAGRGGHVEGYWYVSSMPKTVFVDGRVRFMRAEPMNGEIARLADGAASSGGEVPLGLQYRRAISLEGESGARARLAYLERLTREIRQGTPVSMSAYYGRPEDTLFPWLHSQLGEPQRQAFEAQVEDFVAAVRERGYLRDELIMRLYGSAGMDDAILALAEPATRSLGSRDRRNGAIAKGGVLARRKGPEAGARYLAGELSRYEGDFESERGMNYLDLVHATAQAWEAAGELGAAAAVYQRAIAAELFPNRGSDRDLAVLHHRTSLRYRLAGLEAQRGNHFEAAVLLKQVIESSETHPDWMPHYTGHQTGSVGTLKMHGVALRDLAALRTPAAAPSP